jgi:hypothetical protein
VSTPPEQAPFIPKVLLASGSEIGSARSTAEKRETVITLFKGLRESTAVTVPSEEGLPTAIHKSAPVPDLDEHWDLTLDQVKPKPETEVTDAYGLVEIAAKYSEEEAAVTDDAETLELPLEPPVTTFSRRGGIGAASTRELVFRTIPRTRVGSKTRRNSRTIKF